MNIQDQLTRDIERLIKKVSKSKNLRDCAELDAAARTLTDKQERLVNEIRIVDQLQEKLKSAVGLRASELYGDAWEPVESKTYKVLRVKQGALYSVCSEVDSKFTKQSISIDATKVTAYLKTYARLPDGIELNENRGERVTINLK